MINHFNSRGSSQPGSLQPQLREQKFRHSADGTGNTRHLKYFVGVGQSASSPAITSGDWMLQPNSYPEVCQGSFATPRLQGQPAAPCWTSPEVNCFPYIASDYLRPGFEYLGDWALMTQDTHINSSKEINSQTDMFDGMQILTTCNSAIAPFSRCISFLSHLIDDQSLRGPNQLVCDSWDPVASQYSNLTSFDLALSAENQNSTSVSSTSGDNSSFMEFLPPSADTNRFIELTERPRDCVVMTTDTIPSPRLGKKPPNPCSASKWIMLTADSFRSSPVKQTRIREAKEQENRRRVKARGGACRKCKASKRRCSPDHVN